MSKIRSKNTSPEKIVRKFLSSKGFRYSLHKNTLPGKPDIVFNKIKTVILVNGCFWHRHKGCKRSTIPKTNIDYWLPKLEKNIKNQKKDISELKRMGWKTTIIWECQTKNLTKLNQFLRKIN